ncbi:hypothetical protein [Paludisphaera mucosa]|uniref:TRASH domain-containing protein n=1 Tax=Paludisphaera mucosa TaxID=3030827 RepID=A0ABT6F827_9BACT|nr:hypothetical protein [Paludisphaera mucosa]MDG3003747.1 hypothetical protein [Paludisphaera mucosa]
MDRILRLGAPALALAVLVGCGGAQEDAMPTTSTKEAPGLPPVVAPSKDVAPNPAPSRAEPVAPIPSATEAAPAPAGEPKKEGEPALEAPKAAVVKLSDEELANVKKLPADEQEAALKQAVCPVSDEHLGAMDVPIKVTAEGRTFYLCCKGCEKDVAADAKAVIAKLDKK